MANVVVGKNCCEDEKPLTQRVKESVEWYKKSWENTCQPPKIADKPAAAAQNNAEPEAKADGEQCCGATVVAPMIV